MPINPSQIDQIRKLFPAGTVVLSAPVADHSAELHDSEIRSIRAAVESRKAEFSTGRMLVALALDQLGFPVCAVPRGEFNEPLWPEGIVGSVSHTSKTCVVAVARGTACAGIGIDIEDRQAKVSDLAQLILREDEFVGAPSADPESLNNTVRRAFSAKESVFKAIFAQVRRFVDFQEVSVSFDTSAQRFSARAPENGQLNRLLATGEGGWFYSDELLTTGFYLAMR